MRLNLAHPFSENQSNCPKTSPFPSQSETKYKTSTKTDDKQYPDSHSQASHGGQGQTVANKAYAPMTRSFQAANDHHLKKKLQIQKLTTQLEAQSQHLRDKAHVKGLAVGPAHRSQSQKALLIKQLLQQQLQQRKSDVLDNQCKKHAPSVPAKLLAGAAHSGS